MARGNIVEKENITFRLNNSLLKNLRINADDEKITVNSLVTKILEDYFEWGQNAAKAGWMVIPKITMKRFVDGSSEKELEKIAKEMSDHVLEIMMMMSGQYDLRSFLAMSQKVAKKSGFDVNIRQDDVTKIVIQHSMGKKWSFFRKVFFEQTLNTLGYQNEIKSTPNSLIIVIR
jgi:hypothetical protein